MTFKKKEKGGSYVVTWDSDASSNDDDDHIDDDKTTNKKALASIAINKKPSVFDTPSCFMANATKVQIVMMEAMRNMIIKMKMKVIVMMMNLLKMNYLTC